MGAHRPRWQQGSPTLCNGCLAPHHRSTALGPSTCRVKSLSPSKLAGDGTKAEFRESEVFFPRNSGFRWYSAVSLIHHAVLTPLFSNLNSSAD